MSKAVLVMNMPKNCLECPIGKNMSNAMEVCIKCPFGRCAIDGEAKTIPSWCPLKEVPKNKNRYVFIFDYGRDWMILCYENGRNTKYFNSAEDGWDNSLDYADMFVENGGNKYYYKLPNYDYVASIDVFDLEDKPIDELNEFLR